MQAHPIPVATSGLCRAAAWTFERQGQGWLAMTVEVTLAIHRDEAMELMEPAEHEGPLPMYPDPGINGRSGTLAGDEWLVLYGEGEVAPVLRAQLPKLRAAARLVSDDQPTRLVHLTMAGFCLDTATMRCTVRWRGGRELTAEAPADLALQATVATDSGAISWPSDRSEIDTTPTRGSSTVSISREALARVVLPFTGASPSNGTSPATTRRAGGPAGHAEVSPLPPYQGQQVTMDVTRDALVRARAEQDEAVSVDVGVRGMQFRCEGVARAWEAFRVRAATGFEALNAPPRYDVDVCPFDRTIDAKGLVGKRASLRVRSEGIWRYVHATVTEVERLREAPDHRLRVRLGSPLAAAGHCERSRTFADASLEEVVCRVLESSGLRRRQGPQTPRRDEASCEVGVALEYDLTVEAVPRWTEPRPFYAQYRESDLAYLERLLAEAGLVYRVVFDARSVCVIISDPPRPAPNGGAKSNGEALAASVRFVAGAAPEVSASSLAAHHAPGAEVVIDAGDGDIVRCLVTSLTMRFEAGADPSSVCCRARLALARNARSRTPPERPIITGGQIGYVHACDVHAARIVVGLPWTRDGEDHPPLSGWLPLPRGCPVADVDVGAPVFIVFVEGAPEQPVVAAVLTSDGCRSQLAAGPTGKKKAIPTT